MSQETDDRLQCHDELKRLVGICLTGNAEASRAAFDEIAELVVENNQTILEALLGHDGDVNSSHVIS